MKFTLVTLAYGMIFVVLEAIAAKLRPPAELARKLSHILAGVAAALLPFVVSYKEIALLGALFVPAVVISMKLGVFKSVHGVKRKTYGEVYFPLAICLSALLFPDQLLFTYAVLTLGVSDALASLIGINYGRRKFKVPNGYKTVEGSATFFISTALIGAWLMLALVPGIDIVGMIFWSIVLAGILAFIEARGHSGIDNLFVPLAAAGLLGMLRAFALIGP